MDRDVVTALDEAGRVLSTPGLAAIQQIPEERCASGRHPAVTCSPASAAPLMQLLAPAPTCPCSLTIVDTLGGRIAGRGRHGSHDDAALVVRPTHVESGWLVIVIGVTLRRLTVEHAMPARLAALAAVELIDLRLVHRLQARTSQRLLPLYTTV